MGLGHRKAVAWIQERREHDQMTGLPRDLKHDNRRATRVKERYVANKAAMHDNKWRRIKEREQPDENRGAPGGIRSGNVSHTKPRASLRSKGFRRSAK